MSGKFPLFHSCSLENHPQYLPDDKFRRKRVKKLVKLPQVNENHDLTELEC